MSAAGLRLAVAALLSALLTAGLFAALRALTQRAAPRPRRRWTISKVEFVRLRREVEIEERKREKPRTREAGAGARDPDAGGGEGSRLSTSGSTCRRSPRGSAPSSARRPATGGAGRGELALTAGLSDRAPLPLVRVEPQYPPQAARQGLEGWVKVRFTISTAGSVRDAVVVESSHSVFERAAINAVNKWKYQPQMKEGKPVETSEHPGGGSLPDGELARMAKPKMTLRLALRVLATLACVALAVPLASATGTRAKRARPALRRSAVPSG